MKILNQDDYIGYRKAMANNLFNLVTHHKKHCDGECQVTLCLIADIYKELIGRELTKGEMKVFM